jgi:hypothetical protein
MKQTKIIAAALLRAVFTSAVAGDLESTNTSGSTAATVAFRARPAGFSLVNLDVTSDKAASLVTWRKAVNQSRAAAPAANSVTNITVRGSVLASNDVVLIENAAGTIVQKTVWGRTQTTNLTVTLDNVIGTNLAAGDTFARALTTKFTLQYPVTATNVTALIVDSTNALAPGTPLFAAVGSALTYGLVTNVTQVLDYVLPTTAVPSDLADGSLVYVLQTNRAILAGTNSGTTTNLHVATTNGFAPAAAVLFETAAGRRTVRTVHDVTTTNISVTAAIGADGAIGDIVYLINNITTNIAPVTAGAAALHLGRTNGTSPRATLVGVPTGRDPWRITATANATASTLKTINLMGPTWSILGAGTEFYKLTNTYTAVLAQTATDRSIVLTATNGLTAGVRIIISPATGGQFLNTYRLTAPEVFNTISLTATNGLAISAGDGIFGTSASTTPCGAASLRLSGDSVRLAPPGTPAVLSIDGTSACSINDATVK